LIGSKERTVTDIVRERESESERYREGEERRKIGWVYKRGDCKAVTTELGMGAIGNRLQLSTCINYLLSSFYLSPLRRCSYLSRSVSHPRLLFYLRIPPVVSLTSLPLMHVCALTLPSAEPPSHRAVRQRPCLPREHKIPDSSIVSPINRC